MAVAAVEIETENSEILKTPLWALHTELGARMVPFAGYDMPVQYPTGVKAEHLHVREKAGFFDVSHMGQVMVTGNDGADPAIALEKIMPGNLQGLSVGKMRYTVLLDENGGVLDDLIVTRLSDEKMFIVLNAGCKHDDMDYIREVIGTDIAMTLVEDQALVALQGPLAVQVLEKILDEDFSQLGFMTSKYSVYEGEDILVSRSGYTGEDGFEISITAANVETFTREILAETETVWPIGLGARDSLRLEAGLCLYGHDMTPETTPIEAALTWVIPKARRDNGGFCGAERITAQIANGTTKKRIGLRPEGRAPIREGVALFADDGITEIGSVTSGGYSPILEGPIAMGYVQTEYAKIGTKILAKMRGKDYPCHIVKMPFVSKDKSD